MSPPKFESPAIPTRADIIVQKIRRVQEIVGKSSKTVYSRLAQRAYCLLFLRALTDIQCSELTGEEKQRLITQLISHKEYDQSMPEGYAHYRSWFFNLLNTCRYDPQVLAFLYNKEIKDVLKSLATNEITCTLQQDDKHQRCLLSRGGTLRAEYVEKKGHDEFRKALRGALSISEDVTPFFEKFSTLDINSKGFHKLIYEQSPLALEILLRLLSYSNIEETQKEALFKKLRENIHNIQARELIWPVDAIKEYIKSYCKDTKDKSDESLKCLDDLLRIPGIASDPEVFENLKVFFKDLESEAPAQNPQGNTPAERFFQHCKKPQNLAPQPIGVIKYNIVRILQDYNQFSESIQLRTLFDLLVRPGFVQDPEIAEAIKTFLGKLSKDQRTIFSNALEVYAIDLKPLTTKTRTSWAQYRSLIAVIKLLPDCQEKKDRLKEKELLSSTQAAHLMQDPKKSFGLTTKYATLEEWENQKKMLLELMEAKVSSIEEKKRSELAEVMASVDVHFAFNKKRRLAHRIGKELSEQFSACLKKLNSNDERINEADIHTLLCGLADTMRQSKKAESLLNQLPDLGKQWYKAFYQAGNTRSQDQLRAALLNEIIAMDRSTISRPSADITKKAQRLRTAVTDVLIKHATTCNLNSLKGIQKGIRRLKEVNDQRPFSLAGLLEDVGNNTPLKQELWKMLSTKPQPTLWQRFLVFIHWNKPAFVPTDDCIDQLIQAEFQNERANERFLENIQQFSTDPHRFLNLMRNLIALNLIDRSKLLLETFLNNSDLNNAIFSNPPLLTQLINILPLEDIDRKDIDLIFAAWLKTTPAATEVNSLISSINDPGKKESLRLARRDYCWASINEMDSTDEAIKFFKEHYFGQIASLSELADFIKQLKHKGQNAADIRKGKFLEAAYSDETKQWPALTVDDIPAFFRLIELASEENIDSIFKQHFSNGIGQICVEDPKALETLLNCLRQSTKKSLLISMINPPNVSRSVSQEDFAALAFRPLQQQGPESLMLKALHLLVQKGPPMTPGCAASDAPTAGNSPEHPPQENTGLNNPPLLPPPPGGYSFFAEKTGETLATLNSPTPFNPTQLGVA